jgi:hypothetical protein
MNHYVQTLKKLHYTFNDVDQEAMYGWLQDAETDFCSMILKLVQCWTKYSYHSDDSVEK